MLGQYLLLSIAAWRKRSEKIALISGDPGCGAGFRRDGGGENVERKFDDYAIVKRVAAGALTCALLLSAPGACAFAGTELAFPRPMAIEQNVKFWVDVFATYSDRDFIVHDRDQVDHVYDVIHLRGDGDPTPEEVADINDYLKNKYSATLKRLAAGQPPANSEERRIADMFKGEPSSAYTVAAQNLRVQQGLRERFREGLLRSKYYRPTMERIFRAAGLPPELVTLATVESGFSSRAKSSAGAVGIWQFTRGTGKQYMRITRYHDDRLDPTTETRAAAALLRANYEALGSWPLAITAYNYGTGGTLAAAAEYGGDYDRMVRNYNGPHFGFAVRNYYSEFLAALQIHQDEEKYFPDLKYSETPQPPPVRTDFTPRRRLAHRSLNASVHHVIAHRRHHAHRRGYLVRRAHNTRQANGGHGVVVAVHHPHNDQTRNAEVDEEQTSGRDS
jgi:membrane-bound lytic murein transglycosylase D